MTGSLETDGQVCEAGDAGWDQDSLGNEVGRRGSEV